MKKISKILSIILIFTFIFTIGFSNTINVSAAQNNTNSGDSQGAKNYRSKNHKKLAELQNKRTQNSKSYQNSDGTITQETYFNSIHYKDNNGKWQDISNKIVQSDEQGFDLSNEANSFRTHFAKNTDSKYTVMLKLDKDHKISWNIEDKNKVSSTNDKNSVTYPKIFTDTDLQYQPLSDGLKENIILESSNAPNVFKFDLKFDGLIPEQQSDGTIVIKDKKTNEPEFVFPKAFMIDKNQEKSNSVDMGIDSTDNPDTYILTVTADSNWLKDPSRAYPVTIDPSALTQSYFTTMRDGGAETFIASNTNLSYYGLSYLSVGFVPTINRTRSLVYFNLNLPAGAIVTDAILSLYKYTTTAASTETIQASRITSSWRSTVTWDTQPSHDTTYDKTLQSEVTVNGNGVGYVNFNVWSIVKGWVNGGMNNYGFMISQKDEQAPAFNFYSVVGSTSYCPCLAITYVPDEIGENNYWGYANTSIGAVNTCNGNFITSTTDFSLPGRGMPINVTRTYNNRGNLSGLFGQKWFSNLDAHLEFPHGYIVYIDSSGAERPYVLLSDAVTYCGTSNYPVQLYKSTLNGSTVYRLQEANSEYGTYQSNLPDMVFNTTGKLIQVDDGKHNLTNIAWNSGSVVVTDPSGRTATLALNSDGTVKQITTSVESGKVKAAYTYNNGYLTSITYDNGAYASATINYEWNGGQLRSLTDKNGTKSYINYNSNNQAISIGAVNMLSNPSMESESNNSIDNWSYTVSNDNGSINSTPVSKYGRFGVNFNSVSQPGASSTGRIYTYQKIAVNPNTKYTFSSYIKTNLLGGSSAPNPSVSEAFLNVSGLDLNGNTVVWIDNRSQGISGSKDWTRSSLSFTTAAYTTSVYVYLEVEHDPSHPGGDAYFDGAQLELDSSATSFEGHSDFKYGTDGGFNSAWVTSPAGVLTEYKNDNYGTPVAVIDDPKDTSKPKSETDLVWDAADNLRSEEMPNQVNAGSGKMYNYTYDPVGNMKKATDPLGRTTSMDYTLNRLSKLTEADGSVVQNTWNPSSLNLDTSTNETMTSQAYAYDNYGNAKDQSNLLGVSDNQILNSDFEQLNGNQPISWYSYTPSGTAANLVEYQANAPYNDINGGSNVLHINPGSNWYSYKWSDNIYLNPSSSGTDFYTVSGFIKTAQGGTSGGACINVYWYDSNKSYISVNVLFNVRNTNWQRYIKTLQRPTNAYYAKVMEITYDNYDGYFDNIQFEKSELSSGYNFVENSSFENSSVQWAASDSNSTIISDVKAYSGGYEGKVNRSSVGNSWFSSLSVIPIKPGQYYTMLGFIKTAGVSSGIGDVGATIHIYFYDKNKAFVNDYRIINVTGTTDWTKYVLHFSPPTNSAYAQIRLELANCSGTAYFDNIRFSCGNLASTNAYDSNGNYVVSTKDQNFNTTTITPDAYGQTVSTTTPNGENTQYTYDGQERLRTVTDNAGNTTTYELDGNGNILSTTLGGSNDKMSFTYNRAGQMTSVTDADNNTTNVAYDEDGRITEQSNANGSSTDSSYDNYGNLSKEVLSNGPTYNYNYDLERKLTGASMTGGSSYVYGYDAVGNLISLLEKDASGNTVTTINSPSSGSMYSNKDQILGYNFIYKGYTGNPVAFNYSYNPAGLIKSTTGAGQVFTFNYDESNNPLSRINPNNITDKFTYNDANQNTGIQTVDNNGNTLISNNYTYDKDGRVTNITGSLNGSSTSADYTYNNGTEKLNRLTNTVINDGTKQYTFNYSYDATGNILSMDTANGTNTPDNSTFTYDADNRITNSGFEYDKDGNLTKVVIKGVQYQYEYDAEDRLITVKDSSGNKIASYTYDAEGNRSTKTTYSNNNPVNTTTYHYYNGELLYETIDTDPANVIHALYIRTPAGALEAISLNYVIDSSSNTFYYYHYNAHGDVIAVTKTDSSDPTNITGKIYRQYTYDPYGNIISAKDGSGNAIDINNDSGFDDSYLYAGYRYDKESGLYFLNARYYAPGIGRFLTKDSELDASNTKSLNAYAYTQGDPVNLSDSDGCRPVVSDDGGSIVLGYSSTEGHYHSSSTSVYRNGSGSTKKTVKKKTKKKSSSSNAFTTTLSAAVSAAGDGGLEYGAKKVAESRISLTVEGQINSYFASETTFSVACGDLGTLGSATKAISKVGVIGIAMSAFSVGEDFAQCGFTGRGWARAGIDIGTCVLGIAFAFSPLGQVAYLGIGVSFALGIADNYAKKNI